MFGRKFQSTVHAWQSLKPTPKTDLDLSLLSLCCCHPLPSKLTLDLGSSEGSMLGLLLGADFRHISDSSPNSWGNGVFLERVIHLYVQQIESFPFSQSKEAGKIPRRGRIVK